MKHQSDLADQRRIGCCTRSARTSPKGLRVVRQSMPGGRRRCQHRRGDDEHGPSRAEDGRKHLPTHAGSHSSCRSITSREEDKGPVTWVYSPTHARTHMCRFPSQHGRVRRAPPPPPPPVNSGVLRRCPLDLSWSCVRAHRRSRVGVAESGRRCPTETGSLAPSRLHLHHRCPGR